MYVYSTVYVDDLAWKWNDPVRLFFGEMPRRQTYCIQLYKKFVIQNLCEKNAQILPWKRPHKFFLLCIQNLKHTYSIVHEYMSYLTN